MTHLISDMLLDLSYLNFLLCKTCKITLSLSLSRIWSASFYMGVGWGPDLREAGQVSALASSEAAVKWPAHMFITDARNPEVKKLFPNLADRWDQRQWHFCLMELEPGES